MSFKKLLVVFSSPSFMMDPSQSPGLQERVIRIRTEYLEQMKAALDKVRREYKAEYKQFIANINTESEEVIKDVKKSHYLQVMIPVAELSRGPDQDQSRQGSSYRLQSSSGGSGDQEKLRGQD